MLVAFVSFAVEININILTPVVITNVQYKYNSDFLTEICNKPKMTNYSDGRVTMK